MARDKNRGFGADPQSGASSVEAPIDIAAVQRDDALIDAIVNGELFDDDNDIAALLSSWRADIVDEPLPAGPDIDEVLAAIHQEIGAKRTRDRSSRVLRIVRPLAGVAAAVALVGGGMTVLSYNAEPGDPLWNVKQVVFSDAADSTVANIDTSTYLHEAEQLIQSGRPDEAKIQLAEASSRASDVNDTAAHDELMEWSTRLEQELNQKLNPTTVEATVAASATQAAATSATTTADPSSAATSASQVPPETPTQTPVPAPNPTIDFPPLPTLPPLPSLPPPPWEQPPPPPAG